MSEQKQNWAKGQANQANGQFSSLVVDYSEAINYYKFKVETLNWKEYKQYLLNKHQDHYAKVMVSYAKKYAHLGFTFDLVNFPESRKKKDIMKAIANLCRYFDMKYDTVLHDKWKQWLKQKEISWSSKKRQNSYEIAEKLNFEDVVNSINAVNDEYSLFAKYVLISGLRTEEAIHAFNHHDKVCDGKVTELFWDRGTKKTNAVYCHPEMHKQILDCKLKVNKSGIKRKIPSKVLGVELRGLRRINFTMVAESLKNVQLAKFMQGRTGDISQRLYYLPMMKDNHAEWMKIWDDVV